MTTRTYDVPGRRGLAALVSALVLAACAAAGTPTHYSGPPGRAGPPAAAHPRAELARLIVRARPRGTLGYQRAAFGSDWVDTDHDGCNQRDDVLLRDAEPGTTRVQQQGSCDHDVVAGTWHDPYTGRT